MVVLDERGERLAPAFLARGYEVGSIVAMSLRRFPDRPAALPAEEASFDEVRPLMEEIYRRELPEAPEVAARFVEQHAGWDRILGTRRFVARIDGAPVGQCELYVHGTPAQIEYVDTLEEYRGRGVARAVVLAAAEAARRSRSRIHRRRRGRLAEFPVRTPRVRPDRLRLGVHATPPLVWPPKGEPMAARGDETNRWGDRSTAGLEPDEAWWRSGVLYQIYPRSFADSDGDGVGDLQGVIDRLDHLAWLGVDAIWMNPITPSPDADWGYDVADFTSVHPDLGTLETFDRLVTATGERGIRVMLDLVPNHTSDHHPWFEAARSERGSPFRERYVWADPKPDGSPPNNWRSTFGGPAWTLDAPSGQYYLHNFLPEQPDLNWWNDGVRDAFDEVLRFWMDRGVEGFRIDVANGLVKDRELRDNPPVTQDDHPIVRRLELRPVHNMNRPEVHGIWRRWRAVVDRHAPPGVLLGETWVLDLDVLAAFYGSGEDELHLAMNFPFIFSPLEPGLRQVVEGTEAVLPTGAWPSWLGSNHDVGRFPTRWCDGDERKVRAAMLMLLTLRGTPILYAGDEIGMPEVTVPRERLRDPVGIRGWPDDPGRDGARTPMQWSRGEGAGFTRPGVETWLPLGDAAACNVADQRDDPGSTLRLCRDLLGLRRARRDLRDGSYGTLSAADGVWSWRRGRATAVALNLSEHAGTVDVGEGTCLVGTDRSRDGAAVEGPFELAPWEGVVIETGVVAP